MPANINKNYCARHLSLFFTLHEQSRLSKGDPLVQSFVGAGIHILSQNDRSL